MLGTVIALLYVAFQTANSIPLEASISSALQFLWVWHMTWSCILGIAFGLGFLVVLGGLFTTRHPGLATIGLVTSPILAMMVAIQQTLFLGGVYIAQKAGNATIAFDQWNRNLLILAVIMYGLALLRNLMARISAKSS